MATKRALSSLLAGFLAILNGRMGIDMSINRRALITGTAGAVFSSVVTPLMCQAGARRTQTAISPPATEMATAGVENYGYKVGPAPPLPPLPPLPNPPGFYLFTDGRIVRISGFCLAMRVTAITRAGFARRIPYGLEIETDAQKLWFLGRKNFAPILTEEIMNAHHDDPLGG